jgi:hypothetical protein
MSALIVWSIYGVLLVALVGWIYAAPGKVVEGLRGLWRTMRHMCHELWRGLLGFPAYVREIGRRGW